ncbi:MAG: hypothetical protein KKB13_27845, partial [Chloroflexi bacterium]|nr:hypothetical protein [Chloroflexota bacterium]
PETQTTESVRSRQRQIRIKATSGSKIGQIDFCGTLLESGELFTDREGNITAELLFTGTYHGTVANWLKIAITNGVETLP